MEETIFEKFDELFSKMLQMQEHSQESLLESKQVRQIQQDLSLCMAALEPNQTPFL